MYMTYDYNVQLIDLPGGVKSFVRPNADGYSATIIINSRLNREQQEERYCHEVDHMEGDDYQQEDVNVIETKAHGKTAHH